MEALQEARARLAEIADLESALAVLHWDQATHLPPGAGAARGRQLATLSAILHQRRTDDALGRALDRCEEELLNVEPEGDDACLVKVARRDFERARRVPDAFAARLAEHTSRTYSVWSAARPNDDFASLVPHLETTLDLSREYAAFHPGTAHPADPLIEREDPGVTVESLRILFAELRELLVPLVRRITEQPAPDASFLQGSFEPRRQLAFALEVVGELGYDLERGRQDETLHPFMTRFAGDDVRITTRVREDEITEALFSSIHESGHALYEQGIAPELDRGPLGAAVSSGVHESQSRLWENIVGRSRGFWRHYLPRLQHAFPQLASIDLEAFHRAINRVERTCIRTEADEVTYNLHVGIRFDLELALLDGQLELRDLPEAWNERYREDLGVVPESDADGVMQDVHWYADLIGGQFQGYAIGNVLAAQLYAAAVEAQPEIPDEVARGRFGTLREWLRVHVHRHGRRYDMAELVKRATGEPLSLAAYRGYLHGKYGELYSL